MRVLMVTLTYAPDLGPSASLYAMLCEDLVRLGHEVSVVAAVPHYPTGRVPKAFRGKLTSTERLNGVDVTRVWVPSVDRARLWQRALSFASYQVLSTLVGLRRQFDALIVANPALTTGLPFAVLSTLRRKPAIFSIVDIYPDVGIKIGIFRNRLVAGAVGRMEQFCIDHATYVRVISEGFRQTYLSRGVPADKIALVWDWLDTDFVRPSSRHNAFAREHGLDNAFVAMYAGNVGLSQGLEHLVEAASLLADEPAIKFVVVGDGAGKAPLMELASARGLNSVQFIPFQPRQRLPQVLASADVSLILLKRGIGGDSVPSKFYSILASGRPIIAAIDETSDTRYLVDRADCGVCVQPEEPAALAQAVLNLYHDQQRCLQMGANGRAYVVENHSRTDAARQFDQLLRSMQGRPAPPIQGPSQARRTIVQPFGNRSTDSTVEPLHPLEPGNAAPN